MQYGFQVDQAFFKNPSIYCNFFHIDLHNALHQITEATKHASLECGRGIALAERHLPISISHKWIGERGLFLVLYSNFDLEVP